MYLSAVIITFNEEKNIGRCLQSLKELADDIVVVDSFSTDRTPEIVLSHGARLVQHPFENYIQQKNFANEQARYDFILSLDADEEVDSTLKESILKVKEKPEADAFWLNRLTNYCGHWVRYSWYPDFTLRLYDRRKGIWAGNTPHEWFEPHLKNANFPRLNGHILHYSYYTVGDHLKKIHHYTDLASKSLFEKNKKSNLFKLLANPFWTFMRMYFFKRGFLDGWRGFQICGLSAYATFLKYKKLHQRHRMSKN